MSTTVIARLAAANPVPTGASLHEPAPLRLPPRRRVLTIALAAAVAVPALAFAGRLADALRISNGGTPVSSSKVLNDVLPRQTGLDRAMEELKLGSTMQYLGTLNGASFYATRNADGHFCLGIDYIGSQDDKIFFCGLNDDGFPSPAEQVLPPALPHVQRLQGVAADGVAMVELIDASGNIVASAPVTDNLFDSDLTQAGQPAFMVTLDAKGNVTSRRALLQPPGS